MNRDMQALKSICQLYEFEIELMQPWHARVLYFGVPIFDFFPKSTKLFDLSVKTSYKRGWYTLGNSWKNMIHRILSTYIFCEKLYVDFKEPSFEEKVRRILLTTNK